MNELMGDKNGRKEMEQIIRNVFGAMPIFAYDNSIQQNWTIKLLVKQFFSLSIIITTVISLSFPITSILSFRFALIFKI